MTLNGTESLEKRLGTKMTVKALEQFEDLKSEIKSVNLKLEKAVEALKFYTQPKIINSQGSGWQENIYDATNKFIIGEEDFGHTARATLKEIGVES